MPERAHAAAAARARRAPTHRRTVRTFPVMVQLRHAAAGWLRLLALSLLLLAPTPPSSSSPPFAPSFLLPPRAGSRRAAAEQQRARTWPWDRAWPAAPRWCGRGQREAGGAADEGGSAAAAASCCAARAHGPASLHLVMQKPAPGGRRTRTSSYPSRVLHRPRLLLYRGGALLLPLPSSAATTA